MRSCVVLFSGGIDSTTALYWALHRYDVVRPLTFDYGQRHRVETRLARRLARRLGLPSTLLRVDLGQVGGSALTDPAFPLPRSVRFKRPPAATPATYVPFRNGILIALAAAWAEARGLRDLIVGFNVIDSPSYPDTRRAFVTAMERAVNLGTAAGRREKTRLRAPFIELRKSEIIRRGLALGADYSLSVSCYAGGEVPCRRCSACHLRARAWREAGREDPLFARLKKEGKI